MAEWHSDFLRATMAPEEAKLRVDYVSSGRGRQARFLAVVVARDPGSGKTIYVSRHGSVNDQGDVTGEIRPVESTTPPKLSVSP